MSVDHYLRTPGEGPYGTPDEWGLPEQRAAVRHREAAHRYLLALQAIASWPANDGRGMQALAWEALGRQARDDADLDVHRCADGRGA